jgi:hypothetical protein
MVKSVAAAKQGVLGTAATANVPAREANPNAIGGAAREARPCLLRSQDAQRLGRRLAHVPAASHELQVCARAQSLLLRGAAAKRALSALDSSDSTMISLFSS